VVNKTIGAPPSPSNFFLSNGGDFKCHNRRVVGCIFVCGFMFLFSFWTQFHITRFFIYTWEKTRPYVKTLLMPKCLLLPASPQDLLRGNSCTSSELFSTSSC
uniref:Uncharacterized protein n=1 Tax=Urocitellus parryii TaxID=9999 RepID=A0A8D2HH05_UROPR